MATVDSLYRLYRPIEGPLEDVRDLMSDTWAGAVRLFGADTRMERYVGGKMLRPALCLLSAGAAGRPHLNGLVPMACAYELMHLGALIHDDVVDHASLRRGQTSLNARWDNQAAVLGGDYVLTLALDMLAEYGSCDLLRDAVRVANEMAEGELLNLMRGPRAGSREECIALARKKTAGLFASACAAPTYLERPGLRSILTDYGRSFGMAFQVIDDLLDLSQEEAVLGKPACSDLSEGQWTLPIQVMYERAPGPDRERLVSFLGLPVTPGDRAWLREQFEQTGARDATQSLAQEYVTAARDALAPLPPSPFRDTLADLADFILVRHS